MPQGKPSTDYGFDAAAFDKLPANEQRRLKTAISSEITSDEKHRKRNQRAAERINDYASKGRFATITQSTPSPDHLTFDVASDEPLQILNLDVVRILWSTLPLELHLITIYRTYYPAASVAEIAEMAGVSEDWARDNLARAKRILRASSNEPATLKTKALGYLRQGRGIREVSRLLNIPRSTLARWKSESLN